jgi:hypothetical protein
MKKKASKEIKRRKPAALRKNLILPIRVTREQKEILAKKAAKRGLGVSPWLLSLGLSQPDSPSD